MSEKGRFLTEIQVRKREIASWLGRALLPTEIEDPLHGLERAEDLLEDDYGLVIASSHPSLLDLPRGLAALWRRRRFARTQTILPIAYYQHEDKEVVVDGFSEFTSVPHFPIVTQDAIDKGKNTYNLPKGYGNRAFYEASTDTLAHGGIVYFMPSAGIRRLLAPTGERATEFLFTAARESKVALLTVGVNFPANIDYKESDYRPHIGRKQTYRFGETYTGEELQEFLRRYRQMKGIQEPEQKIRNRRPYEHLDDWIMEAQMPLLVDRRYRAIANSNRSSLHSLYENTTY